VVNPLRRLFKAASKREVLYGAGLTVAGLALLALPLVARLRQSMHDLDRVRATHAARVELASRKGELVRRVREHEAAMAELEARLLTSADLAEFTQLLTVASRAAGCLVISVRPANPRVLPRPEAHGAESGTKDAEKGPRENFVECPVRVTVRGEYGQISALLARLSSEKRHFRIMRLTIGPSGEDRQRLNCELELAGYTLGPPAEGD